MHTNTLKKPNSQLHPNSLLPTRQENTILSSYAAARLLGIISNSHSLHYITNLIYIYIYICHRSAITRSYNPTCTQFPNTACIWFIRINWVW